MEYRQLGTSEVEVSRVIFGAWAIGGWFWGGADDDKAIEAIHKAIDVGVTTIDTAPMYGFGRSERVVGEAIKGRRDDVVLATKCGLVWDRAVSEFFFETEDEQGNKHKIYRDLKRDNVLREFDMSCERLGVDYIDLYQCHWPDATTPLKETMEAMAQLLAEGRIGAIGVSNFTPEMIQECRRYGPVHCDQPEYSMLTRQADADVRPYCAQSGVGLIVYSPMHQGMLTGKVTMERTFPEGDQRNWKPWFKPENRIRALAFLEKVQPIADSRGKALAQVAVNWCLQQEGVTSAIVGARTATQAEENAGGAGWALTEEELDAIGKALAELGAAE